MTKIKNFYPDSPTITNKEIAAVQDLLVSKGVLVEHTRLQKIKEGEYKLLVASAKKGDGQVYEGDGIKVSTVYGDHAAEMTKIAENIRHAQKAALNETEEKMMGEYATSFETGSLEAHKESQKYWIKDIGPKVCFTIMN